MTGLLKMLQSISERWSYVQAFCRKGKGWAQLGCSVHLPVIGPYAVRPLTFVTHEQCNARPTVIFPVTQRHHPLPGAQLYFLMTVSLAKFRQFTKLHYLVENCLNLELPDMW